MSVKSLHIDTAVKQAISGKMAWHYRVVPLAVEADGIKVLMDRSRQINGIQKELEVVLGKKVSIQLVDEIELKRVLN